MTKDKDKNYATLGKAVLVIGLVVLLAGIVGWVSISETGIEWGDPVVDRERPDVIDVDADQTTLKILTNHKLDEGNPAATAVRLYDVDGTFVYAASTSTGVATFTGVPVWEGEHMSIQIRAAAPGNTAYVTYTTKLMDIVVPNADANGVSSLGPYSLWETSTSVATFTVYDQAMAAISDDSANYLNTTDTQATVHIQITSDCSYGTPEDFTDTATGRKYLAGAWLVVKTTATQSITNAVAHFYSSSLHFYIFRLGMIINDADYGYQTIHSITIECTAGFTASADFDFDIYDMCWADSYAAIDENSFLNGDSDLNPTAIASKVA